jgi:anthranilate synthase component 2
MSDITLIIDNYDSFVYNIAQIIGDLGSRPIVIRNDEISINAVKRLRPNRIIISPGPGTPLNQRDIGISAEIVKIFAHKVPILGICLGHQIIGVTFGSSIRRAKIIKHGKTSIIKHYNSPLYFKVPDTFEGMRYHSLVIDNLSSELIVEAISLDDNEIMGIRHVEYPVFGTQFHPESVGTKYGVRILKNFLDEVTEP